MAHLSVSLDPLKAGTTDHSEPVSTQVTAGEDMMGCDVGLPRATKFSNGLPRTTVGDTAV